MQSSPHNPNRHHWQAELSSHTTTPSSDRTSSTLAVGRLASDGTARPSRMHEAAANDVSSVYWLGHAACMLARLWHEEVTSERQQLLMTAWPRCIASACLAHGRGNISHLVWYRQVQIPEHSPAVHQTRHDDGKANAAKYTTCVRDVQTNKQLGNTLRQAQCESQVGRQKRLPVPGVKPGPVILPSLAGWLRLHTALTGHAAVIHSLAAAGLLQHGIYRKPHGGGGGGGGQHL